MNITTMILLGLIKVGNVDKVTNGLAHVEYITEKENIEYVVLPISHADCKVREGTKVYFNTEIILGCL